MIIHDFKTLLSKVKVGDEVIMHWAHKYELGTYSLWSKHIYIIDTIDPVFGIMAYLFNNRYTGFRITSKDFKGNGMFKFELPE